MIPKLRNRLLNLPISSGHSVTANTCQMTNLRSTVCLQKIQTTLHQAKRISKDFADVLKENINVEIADAQDRISQDTLEDIATVEVWKLDGTGNLAIMANADGHSTSKRMANTFNTCNGSDSEDACRIKTILKNGTKSPKTTLHSSPRDERQGLYPS